ncbi:MAG: chemotaxis protein CheW [Proteobacteria bacterium]|nr:chemotaxis protein CheW [Pseudomonadota bacterium]
MSIALVKDDSQSGMAGVGTQFSTFYVAGRLYGIEVTEVQEVVKPLPMTAIPLAQSYIRGLINLRGQVATAVGLHQLFGLKKAASGDLMNVICRCDGNLVSLLADDIGDVMELSASQYEPVPATIDPQIRRFMSGVYKVGGPLVSIIDSDKIAKFLSKQT